MTKKSPKEIPWVLVLVIGQCYFKNSNLIIFKFKTKGKGPELVLKIELELNSRIRIHRTVIDNPIFFGASYIRIST